MYRKSTLLQGFVHLWRGGDDVSFHTLPDSWSEVLVKESGGFHILKAVTAPVDSSNCLKKESNARPVW